MININSRNGIDFFDESSPHMHVVGIAIKDNCKTGMKKQVGKALIFSKDSLKVIQEEMRKACIKFYNKTKKLYNKPNEVKEILTNLKQQPLNKNNSVISNENKQILLDYIEEVIKTNKNML